MSSYKVTLTWPPYPNQGTIVQLLVHRDGTLIATLPGSAVVFVDDGTTAAGPVLPLAHYVYDVTVFFNNTCPSRLALAQVDIGCYAGDAIHPTLTDNGGGIVTVEWFPPGTGLPFYGYTVAWGITPGGPYPNTHVIIDPNALSYIITGLTPGTTYYAIVQGMDSAACKSPGTNEQSVTPGFGIDWLPTNLDLPSLIGKFAFQGTASNMANVTSLTFSEITNPEGYDFEHCPNLTAISFPNLTAITGLGYLQITDCPVLVTVNLPVFVPANGFIFLMNGNAFSAATVNAILARCVANAGYVSGTVNLSGGTSAAPTGQGIVDKATLQGRGVTVLTN